LLHQPCGATIAGVPSREAAIAEIEQQGKARQGTAQLDAQAPVQMAATTGTIAQQLTNDATTAQPSPSDVELGEFGRFKKKGRGDRGLNPTLCRGLWTGVWAWRSVRWTYRASGRVADQALVAANVGWAIEIHTVAILAQIARCVGVVAADGTSANWSAYAVRLKRLAKRTGLAVGFAVATASGVATTIIYTEARGALRIAVARLPSGRSNADLATLHACRFEVWTQFFVSHANIAYGAFRQAWIGFVFNCVANHKVGRRYGTGRRDLHAVDIGPRGSNRATIGPRG
jgi:hypothetical protein